MDKETFRELEGIFRSFHHLAQYLFVVGVEPKILKNLLDAGMFIYYFLVNILIINSYGRRKSRLQPP